VPRARAHEVIAGYLLVERRLGARLADARRRPGRWASRSTRTARSGPWLTTADEVGDPHGLRVRTWVNGELRQDSSTKHLIFDCYALVEHLTTAFTLEPGDVIATGTPSGVGAADEAAAAPARGRRGADRDRRLGALENPVIAEPATTGSFR
jgi:2-keto-4-pentenoate hydratase/2-oxohepta-3-ene-1,7-dioic acid hydratase in catechol pathway